MFILTIFFDNDPTIGEAFSFESEENAKHFLAREARSAAEENGWNDYVERIDTESEGDLFSTSMQVLSDAGLGACIAPLCYPSGERV